MYKFSTITVYLKASTECHIGSIVVATNGFDIHLKSAKPVF